MFKSQSAHSHVLAARDYSDPAVFAEEQERVFRRSWNVVAGADQLAKAGEQLATEVGGVPILVRNCDGELRAFRNVCAHRHSLLAAPGFSCREQLKCQYHGWEYASDGKLSKLPDGSSFKGWKAADARLQVLRCEVAFGLVFVNPTAGSATLRDDFGGISTDLDRHFSDLALHYVQVTEHDANWKVIVENAVEGYHVPMVHPTTFVTYPAESNADHVVESTYTQYHDLRNKHGSPRDRAIDRLLFSTSRLWGYSHTHVFPNHCVSWAGFYREWMFVQPLGPTRSRRFGYGFFPEHPRGGIAGRFAIAQIARSTRKIADKILDEDSSLWKSVQRGTEASSFKGVLSAREERVAAFQEWLSRRRQP